MGAKIEILAFSHQLPRFDLAYHPLGTLESAAAGAEAVFPQRIHRSLGSVSLAQALLSRSDTVYAGTFGDALILLGPDIAGLVDLPADTAALAAGRGTTRILLDDAFGGVSLESWATDGSSIRELMLTSEQGVVIDVGERLHFEVPFWSGQSPDGKVDPEMPFDPSALGEEALRTYFGFVLEGHRHEDDLDAVAISLYGFRITPPTT